MLRLQRTLVSVFAFTASYLVLAMFASTSTFAATATWDGEGADTNFTTATNWVGDTVPTSGDDLVFDTDTADFSTDLNNDMTSGATFATITTQGSESETITIGGNSAYIGDITVVQPIDLELDITLSTDVTYSGSSNIAIGLVNETNLLNLGAYTITGQTNLIVYSVTSGTGGITQSSDALSLYAANTYDGATSVAAGASLGIFDPSALGSTTGATTIANAAEMFVLLGDLNGSAFNIPENITVGGVGATYGSAIVVGEYSAFPSSGPANSGTSATFSGTVTLSGDTTVSATNFLDNLPINLPTVTEGAYAMALHSSTYGTWMINGQNPAESGDTVTIEDSLPGTNVTVGTGKTYVINGARGTITVDAGGVLKGTGTVGDVNVSSSGRLAPGLSPGCLSTGNLALSSASTYEVEIDGSTVCTQYDQTQVTGTVSLGNAALDLQRLSTYTPAINDVFVIIDNDAADAVTGTFNALAEGATVQVDGVTYQASYTGGDGNDVILTVTDIPASGGGVGAPATGFRISAVSPTIAIGAVLLSLVAVVASQKRLANYKR